MNFDSKSCTSPSSKPAHLVYDPSKPTTYRSTSTEGCPKLLSDTYRCMSPPTRPAEASSSLDELPESIPPGLSPNNEEAISDGVGDPAGDRNALASDQKVMADGPTVSSLLEGKAEVLVKAGPGRALNASTEMDAAFDPMESSTATLKPDPFESNPASSRNLSPTRSTYLDPTPKTPQSSQPPSRSTSNAASIPQLSRRTDGPERSPTPSDAGFDEKAFASEDEREGNSRSEIQSIMDQFSEEGQGPGHEEVMSPRLEFAGPLLGSPIQHPPRKSSLEPLNSAAQSMQDLRLSGITSLSHQNTDPTDVGPAVPPKPGSIRSFGPSRVSDDRYQSADSPKSPPLHRPPPPDPEPEPDLPFDFHRFLEQLRHRTADPVAKFLRSFLQEFGKKQWMVHEQVKIISDFLSFITNKMGQCEVWREVSDAEFDNAREGMEKLVMNRLYTQTFSPAIAPPQPIPGSRPRRKGAEHPMGPGRRGQHQEDVERDEILAQKISIYGWIKEEHLDIQPVAESGKRFLILAQQGMPLITSGNHVS